MDIVMVVLRLLHIFGGIFWAGSALMMTGFLDPALEASGTAGAKVMQNLMTSTRFGSLIGLSGIVTVLAGILLYIRVSGGLQLAWITTAPGLALTIGGAAGLVAGGLGGAVIGPVSGRIGQLSAAINSGGSAAGADQLAELQTLQAKLRQAERREVVMMIIAIAGMAAARYL